MKQSVKKLTFTFILVFSALFGYAQSNEEVIKRFQKVMLDNYIFLDKAQQVEQRLNELMEAKHFDAYTTPEELAAEILKQTQEIVHDGHLRVRAPREQSNTVNPDPMSEFMRRVYRYRSPMVNEVKYMEGNVGYFDFRYFGGSEQSFAQIDMVMEQLEQADAMIIDLRQNGGGSPKMVQYICSYFFKEKVLLNSIYTRQNKRLNLKDHTETLEVIDVKGKKRPNIPVFILTSSRTFSAAEDLSYTMQSYKKAQIIGEVTGGGAHPVMYMPLVNGFSASIPYARSINPITKSNWEGTGVIPDVKVVADSALITAHQLASQAVSEYKNSYFEPLQKALDAIANEAEAQKQETGIVEMLQKAIDNDILNEDDINLMGYSYLLNERVPAALAIFKANIQLFPASANAYDSYAEGLAMNGNNDLALENYEKSVALATEQEHPNLNAFKDRLDQFKQQQE